MASFTRDELSEMRDTWMKYARDVNHNPCVGFTPGKRWKCKKRADVTTDYYERVPIPVESRNLDCPEDKKQRVCDIGDMTLFNALLCYSGEMDACGAVRDAQGPDGRWWRNPLRELHKASHASFSRDMTVGVLLYLITTPDKDTARSQARQWIHYIKSNGRLQDRINIGSDIPAAVGLKVSDSLTRCKDGMPWDECVIYESAEVEEWVWEKIKSGFGCFSSFSECWEKKKKKIAKDVAKEIGYWTYNVCPEHDASRCTISPSLWFLFHRVWRDYLGLTPSTSMRFFDRIYISDHVYDWVTAWEAKHIDGFELHLKAVNGLIRALLGKPASQTITTVYQKKRDNPFFQYLMHKYVNNNLHPPEAIRDNLLNVAPSKIQKVKYPDGDTDGDGEKIELGEDAGAGIAFAFEDEEKRKIEGNQWAWERKDPTESVRDTMGWDCVFMANLLLREFHIELDYYKQHVLAGLLRERKRVLNQALSRLAESYGPIQRAETELGDFIDQAATLIKHPDVTYEELDELNSLVMERHQEFCSVSLKPLFDDYDIARAAFESLLRLKEESRKKFQDADRLVEHGELWLSQMASYSDTEELLQEVALRLNRTTACVTLNQLLAAIPLRIEQEKIDGTNDDLRQVEDEVVADLKATAKEREYDQLKTELTFKAALLAEPLRHHRIRRRYAKFTETSEYIRERFEALYERLKAEATLLAKQELDEIREDAVKIIETEQQEWQEFLSDFTAKEIVLARLQILNNKAKRHFEKVQEYAEDHQRALYFQWLLRVKETGYKRREEYEKTDGNAFRELSCWQFAAPDGAESKSKWLLFDLALDGIEQLIADFSLIRLPDSIERARLERRRFPATGVLFDVEVDATCAERISTPDGVRYRGCQIPLNMELQAEAVSPSHGNSVIESLNFFNRLVIVTSGESLYPSSVRWKINRHGGPLALSSGHPFSTDVPVPYIGATLELEGEGLDEFNVFKPGTKVEVQSNYLYPDAKALAAYGRALGRYTKFIARTHRDLAPGSAHVEVVASLDEGIELLDILLDGDDLDAITRRQIENAKARMADGKISITQACNDGGAQLCSAEIRNVRESLSTHIEGATLELTSLRQFLEAEVQRLTGINNDIQQRLQGVLDQLTEPERIAGIQPFLVWIPGRGLPERTADEEIRFVRGERIVFKGSGLDSLLSSAEAPDWWERRVGKIEEPPGLLSFTKTTTSRPCGEPAYYGIYDDQASLNRGRGPVFINKDCDNERRAWVKFSIRRMIASPALTRTWIRERRSVILECNVQYSFIPSYAGHNSRDTSRLGVFQFCGFEIQGNSHLRKFVSYSDRKEWQPGDLTFSVNGPYESSISNGTRLIVGIEALEVQFLSVSWQILNPL